VIHMRQRAFSLVEVMVVAAIVALLVAILVPSLRLARRSARVVRVHGDLRQITFALDAYAMNHRDQLPPTRQVCGSEVIHELPHELATQRYLPRSPDKIQRSFMEDLFDPGRTYRYKAPGPVWQNGTLFDDPDSSWRPRSKVWVPSDFPLCRVDECRYYANRTNEPPSPVAYAVWSVGPDPRSPKFPRFEGLYQMDDALFPLPRRFWLLHPGDTGLITHTSARTGIIYTSP